MASITRGIMESIQRTLSAHAFFATSPQIPVLIEDSKAIEAEIGNAMKMTGAFVMIIDSGGENDSPNIPSPTMSEYEFTLRVSEIPSVWRGKPGPTPAASEIAEATARIIHQKIPTDTAGTRLGNGPILFQSKQPVENESFLQYDITVSMMIVLSNESPTR
jgi:hypothetical protein